MKRVFVLSFIVVALFHLPAYSIDTDPLDFVAGGPGTGVLGLYFGDWNSSQQYFDGSLIGNNSISSNYVVGTYVWFHNVGGRVVGTKIVIPVSNVSVFSQDGGTVSGSGVGDPTLVFPIWLVNKPEKRTYFGVIPRFQLPLGQYDKNNPINPGANRFTFALQPGFTTGLGTKKVSLDLVGDMQFFGKNNDLAGGGSLEQKPLFSMQTHLNYELGPGFTASIGAYKYIGGETKTGEEWNKDRTNTNTVIASLGYWITKQDNFQFQYRADVSPQNGAGFTGIQIRYLHVFF
uniref:Transporter n=1 Tax=uncultured bacterium contig00036 TaxID=1181524 RepID=A0A806KJ10_9BACT|nr:conserved hypothetical protein [uncultured bacterium contig00036]